MGHSSFFVGAGAHPEAYHSILSGSFKLIIGEILAQLIKLITASRQAHSNSFARVSYMTSVGAL